MTLAPPYPPHPRHAPTDLCRRVGPSVAVRCGGIIAHLAGVMLYVAAPAAAVVGSVRFLVADETSTIVRVLGFSVCTGLAFLSMKSLLPRHLPLPAGLVPVSPADQPTASAFIERVAADLGVRGPRRLLVGSGTELGLGGWRSLLDLVRPPRWELHVGLWLWHAVTLSEFQALVARTLAPLAGGRAEQFRSTVRILLRALTDGRDPVDEAARSRSAFAGLAGLVAAVHRAVFWPVRFIGRLMLRIDRFHDDARADDLAAVRLAGSDALVLAILRADVAAASLAVIDQRLARAAGDGVWTSDLYDHGPDAVRAFREVHNDFTVGERPMLRGPTAGKHLDVFPPGSAYLSQMWAGFPPPDEREQDAKREFVAAERDERPAAELLVDVGRLGERLTTVRYTRVLRTDGNFTPVPPMTVRRWLAVPATSPFPPKYAGSYDAGRAIEPGTVLERQDALGADDWDPGRLLGMAATLHSHAGERAATWQRARRELERLQHKTLYQPTGRKRARVEDLEDDVRKAARWFAALDRWAYVIHVHMAARLPDLTLHDALLARYDSVLRFQELAADARRYRNRVAAFADRLPESGGPVSYGLGRDAGREFAASRKDLGLLLAEASDIDDPLLKEWTGPIRLDVFLYSHADRPPGRARGDGVYGRRLLDAWEEITAKSRWLHRLGVGTLLELHEQIERAFAAQTPAAVVGQSTVSAPVPPPTPEAIPDAELVDEDPISDRPGHASDRWYDDWPGSV